MMPGICSHHKECGLTSTGPFLSVFCAFARSACTHLSQHLHLARFMLHPLPQCLLAALHAAWAPACTIRLSPLLPDHMQPLVFLLHLLPSPIAPLCFPNFPHCRPERIRPIAERFGLDADAVLDNIVCARAHTWENQFGAFGGRGLLGRAVARLNKAVGKVHASAKMDAAAGL